MTWKISKRSGQEHPRWNGGAKLARKRREARRKRQLGYTTLNTDFKDSAAHHINKDLIIYIPKEVHNKIWHSLERPDTMEKINKVAFNFLFRGVL